MLLLAMPAAPTVEAQSTGEPLWIGALDGSVLTPVARHAAERWDQPWSNNSFAPHRLRFDRRRGTVFLVGDCRPFGYYTCPSAEDADLGRTGSAPSRWYAYSKDGAVTATRSAGLVLFDSCGDFVWRLDVPAADPDRHRVVSSRPADAVLSESDIPSLTRIRRELDLIDVPPSVQGYGDPTTVRTHHWLGFYLFGDLVVGVVSRRAYEGEAYLVIEIVGDRGRIAAEFGARGC